MCSKANTPCEAGNDAVESRARTGSGDASMNGYVLGVDVGTGSARAGLFDLKGRCLASAAEPIQIWRPRPNFVEQSSEDIWRAITVAVRGCVATAGVEPDQVIGISFDATCS